MPQSVWSESSENTPRTTNERSNNNQLTHRPTNEPRPTDLDDLSASEPFPVLMRGAHSVASVVSHVFYRELRYAWTWPREDPKQPSDVSA